MKLRDRAYLRATLEDSGLSYREIAQRAGISHAVLANLAREGGRDAVSDESAGRLALALGKALGRLFVSEVCSTDVQDARERRTVQGLEGEQA